MQAKRLFFFFFILLSVAISFPHTLPIEAQNGNREVELAFVHDNIVKLADSAGNPIIITGPEFQVGQSARIFWSADGEALFIARRDGLFQTSSRGGAAVKLPGNFGLTVAMDRSSQVFYYLETTSPDPLDDPNFVAFPLREMNTGNMTGGAGRLVGYVGEYSAGSSDMVLNAAAFQYAREGGLLGSSRPQIFPAYGSRLLVSCCFPNTGLSIVELASGQSFRYEGAENLITGAVALNSTQSRLAGPTTDGQLMVIDIISGGWRTYPIDTGEIERVAWGTDDRYLYLAVRTPPDNFLTLNSSITTPIDTRNASIRIVRFDLLTGQTYQLTKLGDFYGVSSMAATHDYIFVVVVENNARLVEDLNAGRIAGDIDPHDNALISNYLPGTILYRLRPDGSEAFSILANVWGVTARPRT